MATNRMLKPEMKMGDQHLAQGMFGIEKRREFRLIRQGTTSSKADYCSSKYPSRLKRGRTFYEA